MARIRTIKPEFWTDEKIGSVSIPARLLLVGALNFADDHGGLDRSAKQLKAQVFPYDAIDCEPLVLELIGAGLLIEYQVADGKYLHIKGFQKHQKVDHPSKFPKTPPYSEGSESPREDGCSTVELGMEAEDAQRAIANTRESSRSNHNHKGIIGEGKSKKAHAQIAPRETESEIHSRILEIKAVYPKAAHEDWITAEKLIRNLVSDGGSWDVIQAGVERYAKFCKATSRIVANPGRWFADISRPWLSEWVIPAKPGQKPAPNHDAEWAEAKTLAKEIGFRDSYPGESASVYATAVRFARDTPVSVPIAERIGLAGIKRIGGT